MRAGGAQPASAPPDEARHGLRAHGRPGGDALDGQRFRCLPIAEAALARGEGATCVLNAANEVAVEAFLAGSIGFLDIAAIVEETLEAADRGGLCREPATLAAALELDGAARRLAAEAAGAC